MEKFYPPEGFTKDEASGQYYEWLVLKKADGTTGNFIRWFNAETGTYTDPQEYIAPQAEAAAATSDTTAAAATDTATAATSAASDAAAPASNSKKKSKVPTIIVLLVLLLLFLCAGIAAVYYAGRLPDAVEDAMPDVMVDFLDDTLYDILPSGLTDFLEDLAPAKSSSKDDEDEDEDEEDADEDTDEDADASDDAEDADESAETDDADVDADADVAAPTSEPTTEPASDTAAVTYYSGDAASDYLGSEADSIMEFVNATWQFLGYSAGSCSIDFSAGNTPSYDAQASNGRVLEVICAEDKTTYQGFIWASNSYSVDDYMDDESYWFVFTTYSTNTADLTCTLLSHPSAALSASYTIANEGSVSYAVSNTRDGSTATAWSCDGNIGETITYTLYSPCKIYGVAILNGYWKSASLYDANATASRLDAYYDDDGDSSTGVISINGTNISAAPYDNYIAANGGYNNVFMFEEPITAYEFSLVFSGLTNGSKYDDLCVSEILLICDPYYVAP